MAIAGMFVVFTLVMRQSPEETLSIYERSEHAVWFFFILPRILTFINYTFLMPQFCAMCQTAFNQIAEAQQRQLSQLLANR